MSPRFVLLLLLPPGRLGVESRPAACEYFRGPIPQRAMGPALVVVPPPSFDRLPSFPQAHELETTAFKAWISSACSATICFSRPRTLLRAHDAFPISPAALAAARAQHTRQNQNPRQPTLELEPTGAG